MRAGRGHLTLLLRRAYVRPTHWAGKAHIWGACQRGLMAYICSKRVTVVTPTRVHMCAVRLHMCALAEYICVPFGLPVRLHMLSPVILRGGCEEAMSAPWTPLRLWVYSDLVAEVALNVGVDVLVIFLVAVLGVSAHGVHMLILRQPAISIIILGRGVHMRSLRQPVVSIIIILGRGVHMRQPGRPLRPLRPPPVVLFVLLPWWQWDFKLVVRLYMRRVLRIRALCAENSAPCTKALARIDPLLLESFKDL